MNDGMSISQAIMAIWHEFACAGCLLKVCKLPYLLPPLQQSCQIVHTSALNQSVSQSINQSVSQSVSQSINQSINQPINQSINQSIFYVFALMLQLLNIIFITINVIILMLKCGTGGCTVCLAARPASASAKMLAYFAWICRPCTS